MTDEGAGAVGCARALCIFHSPNRGGCHCDRSHRGMSHFDPAACEIERRCRRATCARCRGRCDEPFRGAEHRARRVERTSRSGDCRRPGRRAILDKRASSRRFPKTASSAKKAPPRPVPAVEPGSLDPIDGTFNFVRGGDQWAISIGLYENGHPTFGVIFAPLRSQMLVGGIGLPSTLNGKRLAQRGGLDRSRASCGVGFHPVIPVDLRLETLRFVLQEAGMSFRCCGSATVSLIEVALGQVDGYLGIGESSWDLMAALPDSGPDRHSQHGRLEDHGPVVETALRLWHAGISAGGRAPCRLRRHARAGSLK